MSRLIYADKLIECLKIQFDAVYREDGKLLYSDHVIIDEDVDAVIKLVNAMPTAYDIDKVVERLEERKQEEGNVTLTKIAYNTAIKDAIEIVKGGVE